VSPPPDVDGDLSRFAERRRTLETATAEKVTNGAEAGRVLALAGDLLRRTEALGDARMEIEIALEKIDAKAVEAWVESIDADAEHGKLAKGIDDAFDAMLEDGEERVLYMNSAENALTARDALASARAAMTIAAPALVPALDQKLARIDGKLPKNARLLVTLNALRRREIALLDAAEREASWWYASRANCDFLISLYRLQETTETHGNVTQKHNAAHLATCADCQRDVESASIAYTPQHVAASSLWRREHGQATASEIAFMDAHAAKCEDCKRALAAASSPDDA
jgi:hypothetical protein